MIGDDTIIRYVDVLSSLVEDRAKERLQKQPQHEPCSPVEEVQWQSWLRTIKERLANHRSP